MQNDIWIWEILELTLVLQIAGVSFAVIVDPYIKRRHRRFMLYIIVLVTSLIFQNRLEVTASDLQTFYSVWGYIVRPVVIVLYIQIVISSGELAKEQEQRLAAASVSGKEAKIPWYLSPKPMWALVIANTIIYMTAFVSPLTISFDEEGHFMRGPLGYTCHIVSFILLVWLLFLTGRQSNASRKLETVMPAVTAFLITVAVVADMNSSTSHLVTYLTITMVTGTVFYYIWLHLQFVREHEQALMAEQRIRIMMSQIQPHFLYNTLSTIQALCRIDPEQAFDTTEKFGKYLRQNIDSLSRTDMIPFDKELEHTQVYADIEKIRFPNIDVTYDIQDNEFMLPALSIQPLVENAIRHGVRIRDDGLVQVKTKRVEDYHVIRIIDNGKGFDVEKARQQDNTHIGLRNVKERLEKMCSADFRVQSSPGSGTRITIRIPASGQVESAGGAEEADMQQ